MYSINLERLKQLRYCCNAIVLFKIDEDGQYVMKKGKTKWADTKTPHSVSYSLKGYATFASGSLTRHVWFWRNWSSIHSKLNQLGANPTMQHDHNLRWSDIDMMAIYLAIQPPHRTVESYGGGGGSSSKMMGWWRTVETTIRQNFALLPWWWSNGWDNKPLEFLYSVVLSSDSHHS